MKKELEKPEVEAIRFDKEDVIATSPMVIGPIGGESVIDEGDVDGDNE